MKKTWTSGGAKFSRYAAFFIICLMMACLVFSIIQVGRIAFPNLQAEYLVVLSFFVSLEALISHNWIRERSFPEPEWIYYRGSELVVILLLVKLAYYFQNGINQLVFDASAWAQDFINNFFTDAYLFGILLMAFIWVVSSQLADDLRQLVVNERTLQQENESGIHEKREEVREHLTGTLLTIGMMMIVLTALLRSQSFIDWADLPLMNIGVTNLLLYFLLFIAFLSLTQFLLMRANWLRERITVSDQISRRWVLYSVILVLGLVLIARALPTNYSLDLLSILNYFLFLVVFLIHLISIILVTPLILLFQWLLSLFGSETEKLPPIQPPVVPVIPPVASETPSLPLIEFIKSILFWVILLGVVGYSIVYYIRERKDFIEALQKLPFHNAIERLLEWLDLLIKGLRQNVSVAVERGYRRFRRAQKLTSARDLWGYLNLRRLEPREKLVFYYLAMVRRSGETGLPRKVSQTPTEFTQALLRTLRIRQMVDEHLSKLMCETLPDDIEELTEEFIEARYSIRPIPALKSKKAQEQWARIRSAIKRK